MTVLHLPYSLDSGGLVSGVRLRSGLITDRNRPRRPPRPGGWRLGVAPSSSVEGLGLGVWGFAKVPQTSALMTVPGVVALIFVSVYARGVIWQENAASALLYHDLTRCALIGANGCKMNRGAGRQRAARSRRLRASSRARNTPSADRPASGPCIPGHSWRAKWTAL